MPKHISRYLVSFVIIALVDTVLVLCMIACFRLWYVRNAATNAVKFAQAGQPEQVIRELRLAYRWAPAYPAFSETVAGLYKQALQQAGSPDAPPVPEERTFLSALPPAEKALIPADMLVNFLYRKYSRGQATPPSTGSLAEAPVAEFRPGPEEEAAKPAIALNSPPQAGQPLSPPPSDGTAPVPETGTAPQPAYNPDAMWGAVSTQDAPLYDKNGKKMREIPAGSLVDVQETRSTPNGEVVIGSVRSRNGNFSGVILKRDHVDLYVGYPMSATSKDQRVLVSRRGEILAAIKSRQEALEKAASNRNPHQAEFLAVALNYKAIMDEAKQLNEQYKKATGNQRMELGNRLRTLKNDQFVVMPKYNELKQKRDRWNDQNQNVAQDISSDPQIRQLNQQLEQIDQQLKNV